MKTQWLVIGLIGFAPLLGARGEDAIATSVVFTAGTEGYHTFRIPSVIATRNGDLLAFAEARKSSRSDTGDIDLVMRRSRDQGKTWSALQVVADDGPNTIGNPCPVVDRTDGTIRLLLTHNLGIDNETAILEGKSTGTRGVWLTSSTDDGATWSKPIAITKSTKADDWTWYATGPGVGVQLQSGRMVIPCDHYVAGTKEARSHVILSDDHGKSWRIGGVVAGDVNESQVAEIAPNVLMLNMRNHPYKRQAGRAVALSRDGGETFEQRTYDPILVEPGCQGSLVAIPGAAGKRLIFSNPGSAQRRERMTVRLSDDAGKTWHSRVITPGFAAYSCLTPLPDGKAGCLYERGVKHPYETIVFDVFRLDRLENGTH